MVAEEPEKQSEPMQEDVAEAEADKAGKASEMEAKIEDTGEAEPDNNVNESKSAEAKKPPRFVYNCVRCGQYCEKVEGVPVTLKDLRNWTEQQMMGTIMPHLELTVDKSANPRLVLSPPGGMGFGDDPYGLDGLSKLQGFGTKGKGLRGRLRRKKKAKGEEHSDKAESMDEPTLNIDEDGTIDVGDEGIKEETPRVGCPFFDSTNKNCQLYHALPSSCAAYPLGYNGSKYFIVDQACSGIGEGQMTVENLKGIRDAAASDFAARTETGQLLTTLYGLFMGHMTAQSARMMGEMDPEKLKQLSELMDQSRPEEEI